MPWADDEIIRSVLQKVKKHYITVVRRINRPGSLFSGLHRRTPPIGGVFHEKRRKDQCRHLTEPMASGHARCETLWTKEDQPSTISQGIPCEPSGSATVNNQEVITSRFSPQCRAGVMGNPVPCRVGAYVLVLIQQEEANSRAIRTIALGQFCRPGRAHAFCVRRS
jgi:hypothetical protein